MNMRGFFSPSISSVDIANLSCNRRRGCDDLHPIQPIHRRDFVRLGERRIVEDRFHEIIDRQTGGHDGLADVDQFRRAGADDVDAEQAVAVGMEKQFEQAIRICDELASGHFTVAGDADFVRRTGGGELLLVLADHADFGNGVNAKRKQRRHGIGDLAEHVMRGQTPLFVRDVSVGGNQYTDSLIKELDLNFEDAERVKMGKNVAGVSDEARLPVLKSVSEIILLEIQKTFDYFRSTAGGEQILKIYLAGGSARVAGLIDLLKQDFSMPVEELNPFQRITYNPSGPWGPLIEENAPRLAVAVGLALRSFENL